MPFSDCNSVSSYSFRQFQSMTLTYIEFDSFFLPLSNQSLIRPMIRKRLFTGLYLILYKCFFPQTGHFHDGCISEKHSKLIGLLHVLATKTELKMTKPSDKHPLGMSLITASNCKVHYISFSDKDIILVNHFFIRLDYLVNLNPFSPDFQSSIISSHL